MKPIVRTIEETTGYEAADGTFFKTKEECEKYETTARCIIGERFKKLITHTKSMSDLTNSGGIPLTECGEDSEVGIVKLNTPDDVKNANMYMEMVAKTKHRFTEDMIGKDILCYLGFCGDGWTFAYGTIDECVEKYRTGLMKVFEKEDKENDAN